MRRNRRWREACLRAGRYHQRFQTLIDPTLEQYRTDLLYSVKMGGRPGFIHVLLEHQSSSEPRMALRMAGYPVRIYEQLSADGDQGDRIPFVYPLVVHHSEHGWRAATEFSELIDLEPELLEHVRPFVPSLRFALLDLSQEDDEVLWAKVSTDVGLLVVLLIKYAPYDPDFPERLARWGELLWRVYSSEGGLDASTSAVAYILEVDDAATARFTAALASSVDFKFAIS